MTQFTCKLYAKELFQEGLKVHKRKRNCQDVFQLEISAHSRVKPEFLKLADIEVNAIVHYM